MGLLFGLPVAGSTDLSSIIQSFAAGRRSITGGAFGPEAASFTLLVLLLALIPLVRLTRDFAWNYTHKPIVPAGYPMDIPPPRRPHGHGRGPRRLRLPSSRSSPPPPNNAPPPTHPPDPQTAYPSTIVISTEARSGETPVFAPATHDTPETARQQNLTTENFPSGPLVCSCH